MSAEFKFNNDSDTINSFATAMGGLTFAVMRALPPENQQEFINSLLAVSRQRNSVGDVIAGTLLLNMAAAAEANFKP